MAHVLTQLLLEGLQTVRSPWLCSYKESRRMDYDAPHIEARLARNRTAGVEPGDVIILEDSNDNWFAEAVAAWGLDALIILPGVFGLNSPGFSGRTWRAVSNTELNCQPTSERAHRESSVKLPGGVLLATSGTTGTAKQIILSLDGLLAGAVMTAIHQVDSSQRSLPSSTADRAKLLTPLKPAAGSMAFVTTLPSGTVGSLNILIRALALGQRAVHVQSPSPMQLVKAILAVDEPVLLGLDPLMARRTGYHLMRYPDECQSLRERVFMTVVGGGRLAEDVASRLEHLLESPVFAGYGCTELGGPVAVGNYATAASARWSTVGTLLPGVEWRLEPVPDPLDASSGSRGRLLCRSPAALWGTVDGHRVIPWPQTAWVDTGDEVSVHADTAVTFHSRISDQIVRNGIRIDPYPMETMLRVHVEVLDAVVVGVPSRMTGETELVAVVEASPGLDCFALRLWFTATQRGASSKARMHIPQRFIQVAELPRTADGTVIRKEVKALVSQ